MYSVFGGEFVARKHGKPLERERWVSCSHSGDPVALLQLEFSITSHQDRSQTSINMDRKTQTEFQSLNFEEKWNNINTKKKDSTYLGQYA